MTDFDYQDQPVAADSQLSWKYRDRVNRNLLDPSPSFRSSSESEQTHSGSVSSFSFSDIWSDEIEVSSSPTPQYRPNKRFRLPQINPEACPPAHFEYSRDLSLADNDYSASRDSDASTLLFDELFELLGASPQDSKPPLSTPGTTPSSSLNCDTTREVNKSAVEPSTPEKQIVSIGYENITPGVRKSKNHRGVDFIDGPYYRPTTKTTAAPNSATISNSSAISNSTGPPQKALSPSQSIGICSRSRKKLIIKIRNRLSTFFGNRLDTDTQPQRGFASKIKSRLFTGFGKRPTVAL
ncbi:hypothetical protein N7466_007453 [Penicillium verhagenii]|uniref:uncharacterized protein n=1 Tax=Penicillium verhagenii TaxID=1562060 RepID=UPI002545A518|nr:uncharacterized protein N7466_007453 [Penicillium verhagenii]KAJ5928497.1 hypothetical protein N7466_007453 [Penicillium verhagenii]